VAVALLIARAVLARGARAHDGGGVLIEGGRVRRVLSTPAAVRRAAREARRRLDLGDGVLTTGLVNAHAHLELSGLRGALPRGGDFAAWVRALIAARAARGPARLAQDARAGAERCLLSGTTWVGDIDSTGAALVGLARHPLRVRVYRELLDAGDPARSADAMARVARALPRRAGRLEGLAPHAPFTVSAGLLAQVARLARQRALPVSMHWSETAAEVEWLARGSGPLAALVGPSPRASGLELLARARLLGPRLSLVHGNHPRRGEPARLAASGATLVHCPGSHAWFAREPFPLRAYQRAGVRLALGTDSLASNDELDLAREMQLARLAHPALGPQEVWSWATLGGARALGVADRAGALAAGRPADLVLWELLDPAQEPLEALTSAAARVRGVWIDGRRVVEARP
jgi:cytosine/adenosine deaminase-related metal-dependent hydrolase